MKPAPGWRLDNNKAESGPGPGPGSAGAGWGHWWRGSIRSRI